MIAETDALAAKVRAACAPFRSDAVALAADLLRAILDARHALAGEADEPGPQGERALRALQILDDAATLAEPN